MLYAANGGSGAPPYAVSTAFWTFRFSFAITAIGTAWLVYYRWFKMPLASKQLDAAKKKAKVTGYDIQSLKMTCKYFGPRLIATAGTWFVSTPVLFPRITFGRKWGNITKDSLP